MAEREVMVSIGDMVAAATFFTFSHEHRTRLAEEAVGRVIPPPWLDDGVIMALHHYGFAEYMPTTLEEAKKMPGGNMVATNDEGDFFYVVLTQKGREFALEGKHRDAFAKDVIFKGKPGDA